MVHEMLGIVFFQSYEKICISNTRCCEKTTVCGNPKLAILNVFQYVRQTRREMQ